MKEEQAKGCDETLWSNFVFLNKAVKIILVKLFCSLWFENINMTCVAYICIFTSIF